MVRKLLFLVFLFVCLPLVADAEPKLILELESTEVQLGHHINAQLYGIDLQSKLIDIELSELREKFGVDIVETIEEVEDARWPSQTVQLILFKIFPRGTGEVLIPELSLSGVKSKAEAVSVTKGQVKMRGGNANISREITFSSSQSWEREQVRVEITITTPDSFVTLNAEKFKIPGFEVFPATPKSEKIHREGIDYNVYSIGWLLFPLVSGEYNIEIPPIEYHQSGRVLRRFYAPKQPLSVKALPPYIPPTMPVGKISLSSALQTQWLLLPSTLSYWDLQVMGMGVAPGWLPAVIRQVKSNADIQFFSNDSKAESVIVKNGLQSQVLNRIPLKPLANGQLLLPSIRTQYFDPSSGKIITVIHEPQPALVLSFFWRTIIATLITLLAVLVAKYSYRAFIVQRNRRRLRCAALREITSATSFNELRNTLKILSRAEGWPSNLTIQDWSANWSRYFKRDENFNTLMAQLSQACYAKESTQDLETLRSMFVSQLCYGSRRFWKPKIVST